MREVACWADGLREHCCLPGVRVLLHWAVRGSRVLQVSNLLLLEEERPLRERLHAAEWERQWHNGSSPASSPARLPAHRPQVLDNALFAHAESVTDRFFGKDVYYRGELPRERSAILGHSLMCCVFPAPGECMLVVAGPGWQSRPSTCCTFCTWSVKTRRGLCGRGGPSACQPV